VRFSIGYDIKYVACPVPDLKDSYSSFLGCCKRQIAQGPIPNPTTFLEFSFHVLILIYTFLYDKQLPSDWEPDHEAYLENKRLTHAWTGLKVKRFFALLTELRSRLGPDWVRLTLEDDECSVLSIFTKDESHVDFKAPRNIAPRGDKVTLAFGPFAAELDHALFSLPYFIKKIPVNERPSYMMKMFEGEDTFAGTDYTSFESQITPLLMRVCEQQFYKFIFRNTKYSHIVDLYCDILAGTNKLKRIRRTKSGRVTDWEVRVEGRRMSGDLVTSCGNGFTNWAINSFIHVKSGGHLHDHKAVFEGDDGASARRRNQRDAIYSEVGCTCKVVLTQDIRRTDFCGLTFDDRLNILTNPLPTIVDFAWVSMRHSSKDEAFLAQLRFAKALSMLHSYPQCPIIGSFSRMVLRNEKVDLSDYLEKDNVLNEYERIEIAKAISTPPPTTVFEPTSCARDMVSELYGIEPSAQRRVELYFDSISSVQSLDLSSMLLFPLSWYRYRSAYDHQPDPLPQDFMVSQLQTTGRVNVSESLERLSTDEARYRGRFHVDNL